MPIDQGGRVGFLPILPIYQVFGDQLSLNHNIYSGIRDSFVKKA
ncbi:hypothetical protein NIES932_10770 [Raphidiopsis curvata NIES-932]|nr:hypothetical protein NIES932_10770 [Raphidiopsis curvata NIES-932]